MSSQKTWKRYENITRQLLLDIKDYLNLYKVEPKQIIKGNSGTEWEIDVLAYDIENNKIILVECKQRGNSKISQSAIGGFAYIIRDTEADRGIIITTIGLQEGAEKVAKYENISVIKLTIDITNHSDDYIAKLTNRIFTKVTDTITLGGFASRVSPTKINLKYGSREKINYTNS